MPRCVPFEADFNEKLWQTHERIDNFVIQGRVISLEKLEPNQKLAFRLVFGNFVVAKADSLVSIRADFQYINKSLTTFLQPRGEVRLEDKVQVLKMHLEFVAFLKEEYFKVETGKRHWTFFGKSATEQRLFLNENPLDYLKATDIEGRTLLHYAADYGATETMTLIFQFVKQKHKEFAEADVNRKYLRSTSLLELNRKDNSGLTPLHCALYSRHLGTAELLMSVGANVNAVTNDLVTPLYLLASFDFENVEMQLRLLQAMVECGADPGAQTKHGETAFHKACARGCLELVEALLEYGVNPHVATTLNENAWNYASKGGHKEILRLLESFDVDAGLVSLSKSALAESVPPSLRQDAPSPNMNAPSSSPPLSPRDKSKPPSQRFMLNPATAQFEASTLPNSALRSSLSSFDSFGLLRSGSEKLRDSRGESKSLKERTHSVRERKPASQFPKEEKDQPQGIASRSEIINALAEVQKRKYTNTARKDPSRKLASSLMRSPRSAERLPTMSAGEEPVVKRFAGFFRALQRGDAEYVFNCIQRKRSLVNCVDENKMSAIQMAAFYGHLDIVVMLLTNDAVLDPTMKAEGGFLHTLVRSTAIGQFSSTTWEFAVKLLESQSYDIHLQNNYGVSALHEAAFRGHYSAISAFIRYPNMLNAVTRNGDTPLHCAAKSKDVMSCKLLLVAMAENAKYLRNRQGLTPVEIACEHGPCPAFDLIQMFRKLDENHIEIDASVSPSLMKVHTRPVCSHVTSFATPNTTQSFSIEFSSNEYSPTLSDSARHLLSSAKSSPSLPQPDLFAKPESTDANRRSSALCADLSAPSLGDAVEAMDGGLAKDERHCKATFGLRGPRSQFISKFEAYYNSDMLGTFYVFQGYFCWFSEDKSRYLKFYLPAIINASIKGSEKLESSSFVVEIPYSNGSNTQEANFVCSSNLLRAKISQVESYIFTSTQFQEFKVLLKYLWNNRHITSPLTLTNCYLRYSLGTILYPKAEVQLRKYFPEIDIDGFISVCQCAWKNDSFLSRGTMYITKNYLCFHYNSFFFSSKKVIAFIDILSIDVKADKSAISIRIKKTKEEENFFSFQEISQFSTLLLRIWKEARRPELELVLYASVGWINTLMRNSFLNSLQQSAFVKNVMFIAQEPFNAAQSPVDIDNVDVSSYYSSITSFQPTARDGKLFKSNSSPKLNNSNGRKPVPNSNKYIYFTKKNSCQLLRKSIEKMKTLVLMFPVVTKTTKEEVYCILDHAFDSAIEHVIVVTSNLIEYDCEIGREYKTIENLVSSYCLESNGSATYTVLRLAAPMQMFFQPYLSIVGERALRLPVAPGLKIAWIDVKDVVPVVLLLCARPGVTWCNKVYVLDGKAYSFEDVCQSLTRLLSCEVKYLYIEPDRFQGILRSVKTDFDLVSSLDEAYQRQLAQSSYSERVVWQMEQRRVPRYSPKSLKDFNTDDFVFNIDKRDFISEDTFADSWNIDWHVSFWAAIESRSGAFAPVLSTPTPPVSIDEPTTASTTTRTDTTSDALPVSPPTAVDVSWKSLDEFFEHKLAKLKNNYFYVTGAEFNQLFAQYQLLGNSSSVPRDSFFKGPHMGIFFADHELPDGSRPLANTVFCALDQNKKSDALAFASFSYSLGLLMRGNSTEQSKFLFSLLDKEREDLISFDNWAAINFAFCSILDGLGIAHNVSKVVNMIFDSSFHLNAESLVAMQESPPRPKRSRKKMTVSESKSRDSPSHPIPLPRKSTATTTASSTSTPPSPARAESLLTNHFFADYERPSPSYTPPVRTLSASKPASPVAIHHRAHTKSSSLATRADDEERTMSASLSTPSLLHIKKSTAMPLTHSLSDLRAVEKRGPKAVCMSSSLSALPPSLDLEGTGRRRQGLLLSAHPPTALKARRTEETKNTNASREMEDSADKCTTSTEPDESVSPKPADGLCDAGLLRPSTADQVPREMTLARTRPRSGEASMSHEAHSAAENFEMSIEGNASEISGEKVAQEVNALELVTEDDSSLSSVVEVKHMNANDSLANAELERDGSDDALKTNVDIDRNENGKESTVEELIEANATSQASELQNASDGMVLSDFVIMNYTQSSEDGSAARVSQLKVDHLEDQSAPLSAKPGAIAMPTAVAFPGDDVIDFSKINISSINDIFSGSHDDGVEDQPGEAMPVVDFERFNPDHEESGFFSAGLGSSVRISPGRPDRANHHKKTERLVAGLTERKRSSSSSTGVRKELSVDDRHGALGNSRGLRTVDQRERSSTKGRSPDKECLRERLVPTSSGNVLPSLNYFQFQRVMKFQKHHVISLGATLDDFFSNDFLTNGTARRKRKEGKCHKQQTRGLMVAFGHIHWELIQHIMLGIHLSLQSAVMEYNLCQKSDSFSNFYQQWTSQFFKQIKTTHKIGANEVYTFTDYCPDLFWRAREIFNISQEDYLNALGPNHMIGYFLLGKLKTYQEVFSTGRSGSFFFKSTDGHYLIKSLPVEEHTFFFKNIASYYRHITDYPNTFIPQYLGLYKLKNQVTNLETRYVVMKNIFASSLIVHETFDLKGSKVDRSVIDKIEAWNPLVAQKDKELHFNIKLGPHRKALVLQQLEIDTKWLASQNICDYSLLLGVHHCYENTKQSGNLSTDSSKLDLQEYRGGMIARDGSNSVIGEIYFMRIIDTLTTYDFKKRSEQLLKSLIHDANEISAMPPDLYQKRFVRFFVKVIE